VLTKFEMLSFTCSKDIVSQNFKMDHWGLERKYPSGVQGQRPGGLGAKPQKPEITVENMTDEEIDENTQIMKCACIL